MWIAAVLSPGLTVAVWDYSSAQLLGTAGYNTAGVRWASGKTCFCSSQSVSTWKEEIANEHNYIYDLAGLQNLTLYWQWLHPKYSFSSYCGGMVGGERDSVPSWELYFENHVCESFGVFFSSFFKLHDLSLEQDISQSTELWVTLVTCFIKARCPRLA